MKFNTLIKSEPPTFTDEELKNEEWKLFHVVTKPQKYYEYGTKFYISNLGRCRIDDEISIRKPRKSGYLYFQNHLVHRLVYKYFVGDIIGKMDIDHIDRNRQNNKLSNLRLCTRKENMNNPETVKILKINNSREEYIKYQRDINLGRKWINNGEFRKKLFPEDCEKYINEGWKYGLKI